MRKKANRKSQNLKSSLPFDKWQQNLQVYPFEIVPDNILKYFFIYFSEKEMLHNSSNELFAKQTIHMNYQALFSLKNNNKKKYFKMPSAAAVTSVLYRLTLVLLNKL